MRSEIEARACEICGAYNPKLIHRQEFTPLDDGSTCGSYDVVICSGCGHGYADRIPSQAFYDRYYREMSKYDPSGPSGAIDASHPNYADVVKSLMPHFPDKTVRIIDVGSGVGHLLGAFKRAGYTNLLGLDPSPRCAAEAQDRYGVRVVATSISEMALAGERFDLVLLTSVIEHLQAVTGSLTEVSRLVDRDGSIFVDAPDAARFADFVAAPFQQFSQEHISYFTAPSLKNVFAGVGFSERNLWKDLRHDGPVIEPVISALFGHSAAPPASSYDEISEPALRAYVKVSQEIEGQLLEKIASLKSTGERVIVWGVGTLTLRLLASTGLRGLNIAAFVDSNKNYHGKTVRGLPILAPPSLKDRSETIIVSSRAHQDKICKQIREDLHLNNAVVTLFE